MKRHRIEAVIIRQLHNFRRNWDRMADVIYWPIMDLLVWGLSSVWIQRNGGSTPDLVLIILTALVFWQIVHRTSVEVALNLLEETWNHNTVNLFATPLTTHEWVVSVMLLGVIKTLLALIVGYLASWMLYSLNILQVGYLLIPFLASLILFGWTLGFIAAGFVMRFGHKVQMLAWSLGWLFAPLSAVYYPMEALPRWAQTVAQGLPTVYVFEGMRSVLSTGSMPLRSLGTSLALNLLYLGLALAFFFAMFEQRRRQGLQSLD